MLTDTYKLTPKRKSFLWKYNEDGTVRVLSIAKEKEEKIKKLFLKEKINSTITENDGIAVSFNRLGTSLWEKCDGITTVFEMIEDLIKLYDIGIDILINDINQFLNECNSFGIIDKEWRSIS